MCGIIGYTGPLQARGIVLLGLSQLEYRGYDSAGLALLTEDGGIYLKKKVGQVKELERVCSPDIRSHCGIGHTRWATHGGVTDANAHAFDKGQNFGVVHHAIQAGPLGIQNFTT